MKVKVRVRGIEAVQSFLRAMPRGTIKVALAAFTKYVVGNEQHGLRHAEPYKYVSRKSAYGKTWFSEKQRRWFWANGGPDMIGNHRTGKSTAAWKFTETKNGYGASISNDTPGGFFTRDDKGQAWQPCKVGWRKVGAVIADNYLGAVRHAVAEVKKFLNSK